MKIKPAINSMETNGEKQRIFVVSDTLIDWIEDDEKKNCSNQKDNGVNARAIPDTHTQHTHSAYLPLFAPRI